jgi:hypothetical protein
MEVQAQPTYLWFLLQAATLRTRTRRSFPPHFLKSCPTVRFASAMPTYENVCALLVLHLR